MKLLSLIALSKVLVLWILFFWITGTADKHIFEECEPQKLEKLEIKNN